MNETTIAVDVNITDGQDASSVKVSNSTEFDFSLNYYSSFTWIFLAFFVTTVIGFILNGIVTVTLLRTRRDGILNLVLQISFADSLLCYVAVSEVWSLKENSWIFPAELCPLFSGSEILANTLILYLIISFNFHMISLTNLHIYELERTSKNPLTSCDQDESNECLVRRSDTNRSMATDYRKRKSDLNVILPSMLIWFTSLSLSIPNYTLASTINIKPNSMICTILDLYYGKLLQVLLILFRVVIPVPLLMLSIFVMLWKLYQSKYTHRVLENILSKKTYDVQRLLIFNIALTLCYCLTSLQRQYFYVAHTFYQKFDNESIESFKIPPLHNIKITDDVAFILAILHYSAIVTRCLLYVLLLPKFANLMKNKLFGCCNLKR